MQCSKCSSIRAIVEGLGSGVTRVTCQECGHVETRNEGGKRLLTDDESKPGRGARPLTEG